MSGLDEKGLADRITDYLSGGGLFNPEAMEHEKVRNLLIDCRAHLAASAPPAPDGLAALLRHLISLDAPEKGGPYQGLAARECLKAMSESAATLSAQEAEIERLRKERDALARKLDPGCSDPALISRIIMRSIENETDAREAESEVARLRKVVERAKEVVAPFAEQSKRFDDAADQMGFARSFDEYKPATEFTHGHLRAARQFAEEVK